ncbi:MAG: SPOR domain-containing protein [Pseudomonadota bacterium]
MATADENYEDEYSDYDGFEDDEDEGGLSGFSVLMIGLVMFGAFAATTYFFYQKGIRQGERRAALETPYVAADPEPIKIETTDSGDVIAQREVYDAFDGEEPAEVNVITQGPEEPVARTADDPIAALAADADDDVRADAEARIASLAEDDAAMIEDDSADAPDPAPVAATAPTPASASSADTTTTTRSPIGALSGTHVVQVGAFRSNDEALAQWSRMQSRLSGVIGDKTFNIEEADLGDRGVYHRLRVGPFGSSDDASAYCAALKENGQDCLIKRL